MFPCGLNDRIKDKLENDNRHVNVTREFLSLLKNKNSRANHEKNKKDVSNITTIIFRRLNHLLNTNIKDVLKFIRTFFLVWTILFKKYQ